MQGYGLMWDSATGAIPVGARLRALYFNGRYASPPAYGRGRVFIDVLASAPGAASWLDVETGDATPGAVPGWLDLRGAAQAHNRGVYCNRGNLPAVIRAAAGRQFNLWLATLDGTIPATADLQLPSSARLVAVQAFGAAMLGFNADLSVVVDRAYWDAHYA